MRPAIAVQRHRNSLREGVNLKTEDGLLFRIRPHWGHIGEDCVSVAPWREEERGQVREAVGGFSAEGYEPFLYSRDPRLILLALRYLLDQTGYEKFNLRKVENDEEKALRLYDALRDKWGHIVQDRWRSIL